MILGRGLGPQGAFLNADPDADRQSLPDLIRSLYG
jgi:hypothetical protein